MRTSLILSILLLIGLVGCANRTKTHTTKVEDISTFMEYFDPITKEETVSFSFDKPLSWEVQFMDWEKENDGFYTVAHGTGTDGEVPFGKWMKMDHNYSIRIITGDKIHYQFTGAKYKPVVTTIVLP